TSAFAGGVVVISALAGIFVAACDFCGGSAGFATAGGAFAVRSGVAGRGGVGSAERFGSGVCSTTVFGVAAPGLAMSGRAGAAGETTSRVHSIWRLAGRRLGFEAGRGASSLRRCIHAVQRKRGGLVERRVIDGLLAFVWRRTESLGFARKLRACRLGLCRCVA